MEKKKNPLTLNTNLTSSETAAIFNIKLVHSYEETGKNGIRKMK